MDEQRFQAYVKLIEALLGCPQGQEDLLLQANVARLDEALLSTLPTVFASLIQQIDPCLIAEVFNKFGNLIQQFPLGNPMGAALLK